MTRIAHLSGKRVFSKPALQYYRAGFLNSNPLSTMAKSLLRLDRAYRSQRHFKALNRTQLRDVGLRHQDQTKTTLSDFWNRS